MRKIDLKKVMEWLGFILRCPICGYRYNLENTKVIDTEHNHASGEAKILIHTDCTKCNSSVMFNIEIIGPEVFSVGMVTDLTRNDSSKFNNLTPIGTNDVIDLHKTLKTFDGDFVKSFGKK